MTDEFKPSKQAVKDVKQAEREFMELTMSIMMFLTKNGFPLDHVVNLLHKSVEGAAKMYDGVKADYDKEHKKDDATDIARKEDEEYERKVEEAYIKKILESRPSELEQLWQEEDARAEQEEEEEIERKEMEGEEAENPVSESFEEEAEK